ncbi:MAG: helix-turn-helix transcriptional regulator [Oscillospiraceae bacterium]|nr:helix-turn-helix transcriptional regulator [Oscillospiraceae bacterium]
MTFGDRLRKLRKQHHMTQEQVAKSLNIVRSTYAYYETGKTRPDFNTVVRLAHLFNVTTDYLLDANTKASQNDNPTGNFTASTKKTLGNQWRLRESEQKLIIAYRYLDENMQKEFLKNIEEVAAQLYEDRHKHEQKKKG